MAEQDYEIWSVTVPYLSAGDLMNIYFDSRNIPTPNRMNWKDPETDDWLKQGRSALTEADRAKYYALVQQKVTRSTCGFRFSTSTCTRSPTRRSQAPGRT